MTIKSEKKCAIQEQERSQKKYNFSVSVPWAEVSDLFYWRLGVLVRDAQHWVRCSKSDVDHNMGDDFFKWHEYQAALACETVFSFVSLFSSLRAFLKYRPLNEEKQGVADLRRWYSKRASVALSYGIVPCPCHSPISY